MDTRTGNGFDELMDSEVFSDATDNAAGVTKRKYRQLVSFQNVMTHSSREKYHECKRFWQFMKMDAASEGAAFDEGREENVHFAYGHAMGAGIATFDQTLDINAAILAAFLAWDIDLLAIGMKKVRGKMVENGKTFAGVVWALKTYETFRTEETDLNDYEVVENEATILVDWEDGWFDSFHVDTILRHKHTGQYRVKENKTTGLSTVDAAMYSNSEQALGYAVGVDMLPNAGQEYNVIYCIYMPGEQRWITYDFPKSTMLKVEWIQDQLNIHQDVERASEQNFFPKNGAACWTFGRRCKYYESCDIKAERVFGRRFSEGPVATKEALEKVESYTHITTLTEILQRQKQITQRRTNHDE